MDAVKFLEEVKRMCDSYGSSCHDCEFRKVWRDHGRGTPHSCLAILADYPEESATIVEKWSAEHPQRTRLQDFLEKHPNAIILTNGLPMASPRSLGYCEEKDPTMACLRCEYSKRGLEFCWNLPLEE